MQGYNFDNIGFLKEKLSKEALNKINSFIRNRKHKVNKILAGNLKSSYSLHDKDNWFFKNVLLNCITQYRETFGEQAILGVLSKSVNFKLNQFWVNYQKKYEFNPMHNHSGIFSFVIWIKIPASYKKEQKLSFIKESNNPCPNTFSFIYPNSIGKIMSCNFKLEPSDNGTMLFFPSTLNHMVYPFYTSNKERISVSGNICYDV